MIILLIFIHQIVNIFITVIIKFITKISYFFLHDVAGQFVLEIWLARVTASGTSKGAAQHHDHILIIPIPRLSWTLSCNNVSQVGLFKLQMDSVHAILHLYELKI